MKIFEAIAEQISNGILERFLKESLPEKFLEDFQEESMKSRIYGMVDLWKVLERHLWIYGEIYGRISRELSERNSGEFLEYFF